MSKSRDPKFELLQKLWYDKLASEGFKDCETLGKNGEMVLKRETGVSDNMTLDDGKSFFSLIDQVAQQPEYSEMVSSFPENVYTQQDSFTNHPEFEAICKQICKHKNSTLTPVQVAKIWDASCQGLSNRKIAELFNTSDTTVFHVVRKLTSWMKVMSEENE